MKSNNVTSKNILFIDSQVQNYQALVENVGADTQVFILNNHEDGIEQISNVLANYSDIDSVQIISHGGAGMVQLGNTVLNNENLQAYSDYLQGWRNSLTDNADILFYGCNVGEGELGVEFLQQLGDLTGADIAASNDLTGNSVLGGDWELEVVTGNIEAESVLAPEIRNNYQGVLAVFKVTNNNDTTDTNNPQYQGSLRKAIIDANSNPDTDVIDLSAVTGLTNSGIWINSSLPTITQSVFFVNNDISKKVIIDGRWQYQIISIDAPNVTVGFQGIQFQYGLAQGGDGQNGGGGGLGAGGAIFINAGNVAISNSTFYNNKAQGGNSTGTAGAGGDGKNQGDGNAGGAGGGFNINSGFSKAGGAGGAGGAGDKKSDDSSKGNGVPGIDGQFGAGGGGGGGGGGGDIITTSPYSSSDGGAGKGGNGGKGGLGAGGGGGGGGGDDHDTASNEPGSGGSGGSGGSYGVNGQPGKGNYANENKSHDTSGGTGGSGAGIGGAIYVRPNSNLKVYNTTFSDNKVSSYGSDIAFQPGDDSNPNFLWDQDVRNLSNSLPTVAITSISNATASEQGKKASFTLNISNMPTSGVDVYYYVSNSTATTGIDFTDGDGKLKRLTANDQIIELPITDDLVYDPNESLTLNVQLLPSVNYKYDSTGLSTSVVTIIDNEPLISIAKKTDLNETGLDSNGNKSNGEFTITLDKAPTQSFDLYFSVSGTAKMGEYVATKKGSDYKLKYQGYNSSGNADNTFTGILDPNNLKINVNNTNITKIGIIVEPVNDEIWEGDETVTITLLDDKTTTSDGYRVDPDPNNKSATVTITDNEPTVTLGKVVNPTEGFGFGSTIEGLGAALNLNGSNYVTISSNDSLNLTKTGQFTQEAWIFANLTDDTQRGILGSDNYPSIWVENKTTIKVGIGNKTFSVTNALNPSSWNHVATTFDGKEYKLYVNGVERLKDTTFTGTNISAIQQLNIGKVGTNDNFVGAIDEVRLWNVARTQTEIQSYMLNPLKGSEQGLIGYWQFEGNLNDTTTNNQGLIYLGDVTNLAGTITASGENVPNEGKAQAFDDLTNTKWLVSANNGWLQYQFNNNQSYVVTEYKITSANDVPTRDPKNWILQGSNNGSNWTNLDTRNNETFSSRFQTRSFTLSNSTSYSYYRLNITANNGNSATQLAELQLFGSTPNLDPSNSINNPAPQIGYVEVKLDKSFEGPQGLWVEYDISAGTATQNIDYFNSRTRRVSTDIKTERNGIIIPKGETSARIYVSALSDAVVEGDENVTITLRPTNFDIFDVNNDGNYTLGQNGLLGEYYNTKDLTGTKVLSRIDSQVNFSLDYGSPAVNSPAVGVVNADNFSVRWTGLLAPTVTGQYTFYTKADDGVRLWVNEKLIIDNWTDHPATENNGSISLEQGKLYDIKLEYYEGGGGATIQLLWQPPNGSKQIIPSNNLLTPIEYAPSFENNPNFGPNGLLAEYYNSTNFTGTPVSRIESQVNLRLDNGSPYPGVNTNNVSVRWTGKLAPTVGGKYTFYTNSDDGVRMWVNGVQIINNWTDHAPTENSGSIDLEQGKVYDIKLEYYQGGGGAIIQLSWQPPAGSKEIIPAKNLFLTEFNNGSLSQTERDVIGYNYKVGTNSTATIAIKDNQAYQKGVILLDEYGQEVSNSNKLIVDKNGNATFQVKLTSQPTSEVTLNLSSGLGSLDTTPKDTPKTTSVTIQPSAWDTPQSVTLNEVTGTNVSNNITVSVPNYLTTNVVFPFTNIPSDKVRITEGSTTDTIAVTPVVTISKLNDVNEGDIQPGQFVINLSAPAPAAGLSVQYQLTGSAIAGTDYTPINTINIAPGETRAVIPVYPINDDIAEGNGNGNEQVTITLLNPATGYTLGSQTTATLNIIDDDKAGIALSDAVVSDTVTTYTGNFDSLVTSEPYPRNGDILQLFDQQTGTLVKEITLTQTVIDAGKVNISGISANSTLKAILKESSNAKGSVNIGTVTVKLDGTVDVTLPKNVNTDTFGVRLSSKPTADVTITFNNIDSTEATFSKSSLTFTIANWDQYQSVTITGLDDTLVDGDIKYTVTAKANSTDAKYNDVTTSIAITNLDDDDNIIKTSITNSITGPKVSLGALTTIEFTEGNQINLTVNLDQPAGTGGSLIFYSVDGKDFKYGEDYTVPAANQVYLKETTDGVELTPTDVTSLSGTKENKDLDGDGDLDLVVTNGTTTTNYYQFQAVKIAQGQSSATITVNTIDDKVDETDESVKIVLKAGTNYQVATDIDGIITTAGFVNLTVKDNDTAGITITPSQTQTSTSENSSFLTYTVQLNSQPTKPVTVYIGSNDSSEGKIKIPTALSFDGVDDYVSVANRSSLNITEEITIETWVNLANSAKNQKIIGKTPVGSGYLLGVVNGKLNPEFWDSQGNRNTFESGQIPSNQWTHIAVTWKKGGSMIGYINGIEVGRTTASSNPLGSNNRPLIVGKAPWDLNEYQVNGAINEVRIWNVARNQQDIQNNKNLLLNGNESGLVAYYKANEGSGTTLIDSTVNKSNGILQGGTSWTQTNSEPSEFISRTFNTDNWNTPQTFQVAGINDAIADGTVPYNIITTVTSEDPNYNKLAIAPIPLTNTEDSDTAKIIITPPGQVEEGRQNVYSVKLSSQPVGEIRVIMTPKVDQFQLNNEDIGEPLTLTFNASNWNQTQTVRVTAVDDSVVEYFQTSQIEFKVETGNVKDFESKWQNNTPNQALDLGKITGGIERTGLSIDSSISTDIDWYKFTLPTQGTAKDFVEIQFANAKGDLNLELYQISNSATAVKTSLSTTTDKERIELNGLNAGDYLLKVSGKDSTTSNDYKLILGDADYQYRTAPIVTTDGKTLTALDVTIKDNDLPTAKIIAGPTASEVFGQPSYFTVQLNAPAPLDGNGIVVGYNVVGGSATLNTDATPGDYRIQNNQTQGTVRIAPGEIQANIIVSPVDDKLVEDVEWKITKKVEGSTTNGKTTLNLDVNSPINGKVTKLFKNQTIKFGDSIEGTLQKDVQLEEYLAPVTLTKIAAINSLKTGGVNSVSENGRYVVVVSTDSLATGDNNNKDDVFLVDTITNIITRVSIGLNGQDTSGFRDQVGSDNTQISADGRYISYVSGASNIVSGDTNGLWDIFVYDTVTKQNTRVNLTSTGAQATGGNSYGARISGDGNYIAFVSNASNLDSDVTADAFVYNRQKGELSVVSKNSSGTKSNNQTYDINISADGRFVVFASNGNNLVSGDTNSKGDIFVHEILTGKTTRVNVSSDGTQATDSGFSPSISGDGRYIIFESDANNLVSADTNNAKDVFIHDRQTGSTSLISLSSDGIQGNAASSAGNISSDGRYVLFRSNASNLVINDNNNAEDIFLRDRQTGDTVRIIDSRGGKISADGRSVVFVDNIGQLYVGKIENQARGTIEVTLDSTLKDRVAVNSVAKMMAETVIVELLSDANTTNPTYTLGGEDTNLNGKLDVGEDKNTNSKLDPDENTSKATLSILDDDVPGIRIVEVGNHTVVREKETATFEVSLLGEPKNPVTITLTPGAEIEFVNPINPTNVDVDKDVYKFNTTGISNLNVELKSLVFTDQGDTVAFEIKLPQKPTKDQIVELYDANDTTKDLANTKKVTFTAQEWDGIQQANIDGDWKEFQQIVISNLNKDANGNYAIKAVIKDKGATSGTEINIPITRTTEKVTKQTTTLTINPTDWYKLQTVTIKGSSDAVTEPGIYHADSIKYAVTSADKTYQGIFVPDQTIHVVDRIIDSKQTANTLGQGLKTLQDSMDNLSLPLIGSLDGVAPDPIAAFSQDLVNAISSTENLTASKLKEIIENVLSKTFSKDAFTVKTEVTNNEISVLLDIKKNYELFKLPLSTDLGIPALGVGLTTEGDLQANFNYNFSLGFGLHDDFGFYIDTDKTGFKTDVTVDLNQFKGQGSLGFLKLDFADDANNPSKLQVSFEASLNDLDNSQGVQFFDVNSNNQLDSSEPFTNINEKGIVETKLKPVKDVYTIDTNKNGIYDEKSFIKGEGIYRKTTDNKYYFDVNRNGILDTGELSKTDATQFDKPFKLVKKIVGIGSDGTKKFEYYYDANGNGIADSGETTKFDKKLDKNNNLILDGDLNIQGEGKFVQGTEIAFLDANSNGKLDAGEKYINSDNNVFTKTGVINNVQFSYYDFNNNNSFDTGDAKVSDKPNIVTVLDDGSRLTLTELTNFKKDPELSFSDLFNYKFAGEANLGLNAKTTINNNTNFPSVSVDLAVNLPLFNYGNQDEGGSNGLSVNFNNITVDLGGFISDVVKPVIGTADKIITPIKPIIQVLNADTKIFGYIGLESTFDTDGKPGVSILEIAKKLDSGDPRIDKAIKFAETVSKISEIVDLLKDSTKSTTANTITINQIASSSVPGGSLNTTSAPGTPATNLFTTDFDSQYKTEAKLLLNNGTLSTLVNDLNPNNFTFVITHGFQSSVFGQNPQFRDLGSAIHNYFNSLNQGVNVVLWDWSTEASGTDYKANANKVVGIGEELAKFLQAANINPTKTQLIGHSLGSHVMGNAGESYNRPSAP
ncbi:PA14 domain-containing protein [Aphanizomenon flos-aquae]|uniref:DUF4347 domain-containing protein n=1 Tax=Aphanizomenon flos-aquae FACHB-1040 TaxID=2692887 RepID=A0ABR8C266_APHFL|nr:PA14 domain-containing protein [Aphanizomenon flos-aquae]MBD2280751.1 DUF4347 domain-containing protein [Aphanizomenon flos-aquae FACHB-1040]